ncbi:MAG: DNA polymerase III subunit alpha [Nitrospinota bacterium]|nr:DNA polymerase III subunit alpha [Nitrospinota bacterium]
MHHSNFVHLHLHTHYSLLDSSIRHEPLFRKAEQYKMPAIAMTDHGNLFGAVEFFNGAKKHGLKPIIGCELYVAPESRLEKKTNHSLRDASHHLILLAKNEQGYKNLLKLVTAGYLEGFYYKPRIDKELLAQHRDGLIALSSCSRGEVGHNIYRENLPRAAKVAAEYKEIMGNGNFYLELQDHKLDYQEKYNKEMVRMGSQLSIPVVATNNCHYMEPEDARAHEILLCLQTGKTISDSYRMRYPNNEYYFKSGKEMSELFKEVPEAIKNTIKIAEHCNLDLDFHKINMPDYPLPDGKDAEDYLREVAKKGLKDRLELLSRLNEGVDEKTYNQRLDEELNVICDMGYPGYFLIVWDFIRFARENHIPVGPGRGSAAGSLVAYALKVTDLDPMEYGLLFERFLNPERVSLPDIEIDLCMDRRDKVIDYVTEKYGGVENVTQLITFGSMKAKAVIRDVGRVLDMTYGEVDKIAKLVPSQLNITLKQSFKEEPQFEKLKKEDEKVKELLDIALRLEGLPRHCSTHAAGVVISPKPLTEFLPLCKTGNGEVVTQFAMNDVEKLGLLKMDFLGLRTLTVIDNAVKLIKQSLKVDLDMETIPKDDPETFAMLSDARAMGIFQLESSGMRDLLKKMKPDCFEDIIALLALYRPGPLESGMVDDYIKCKHGHQEEKYDLPQLEEILHETHGVILYQEQVMKIASVLAGFTLGDADLLRRAMGKKKPEEMERQREKFYQGCKQNQISSKKAEKIFTLMEKFAGYGFNKSHSAAYALVSYQTAYLKAHYPLPFFGALITSDMDNTDKVIRYIGECRELKIQVTPPNVNESFKGFTISKNKLLFGLGAIKNVGSSAIEAIIEARGKKGRFSSLEDFCASLDLRSVNKRVIESLIKSGAMDSLGESRAARMFYLEGAMDRAQAGQRDRQVGQSSMFDLLGDGSEPDPSDKPFIEEWTDHERLGYEKETLGFYISGHPLTRFQLEMARFADATSVSIPETKNGKVVCICGVPSKITPRTTRKGDKMAQVTLEDLQGTVDITVWPEVYSAAREFLASDEPLLVKGKVEADDNSAKLIALEMFPISEIKKHWKGKIQIHFRTAGLEKETLVQVKNILAEHKGNSEAFLHITFPDTKTSVLSGSGELKMDPSDEVIRKIESVLGEDSVRFK